MAESQTAIPRNEVSEPGDFRWLVHDNVSETTAMRDRGPSVALSAVDRDTLTAWAKSRTLASRVVIRSRIVLSLASGHSVKHTARTCGVAEATVRRWRERFMQQGSQGLLVDAPGRGRKPRLDSSLRDAVRAARGTTREIARRLGVSAATVSRWRKRT